MTRINGTRTLEIICRQEKVTGPMRGRPVPGNKMSPHNQT